MPLLPQLRVWLKHLQLYLAPDARRFYTVLADEGQLRSASLEHPRWLNLGYWKTARRHVEACANLAEHLGHTAELRAGDSVLDVGFGYGDQDLYWIERFGVDRVVGINVTPVQVEVAKARAEHRGLSSRLDFRVGSAAALPFDDNTFDKVLSLEAAFHFPTRERFFREAYRVLKPNGRMIVADMIPLPGEKWRGLRQTIGRRIAAIPDYNMYDRERYGEKLRETGFNSVQVESIRSYVYPGFAKCLNLSVGHKLDVNIPEVVLTEHDIRECTGVELWTQRYGISDYVVAVGHKRGDGTHTDSDARI